MVAIAKRGLAEIRLAQRVHSGFLDAAELPVQLVGLLLVELDLLDGRNVADGGLMRGLLRGCPFNRQQC